MDPGAGLPVQWRPGMRDARVHLDGLARLHRLDGEERRAEFRQCFATLAAAAAGHSPVPLEGLDPQQLRESTRVAHKAGYFDDLGWLRADHAVGAIYELANALPQGEEKRELGRRVLLALNEGDAPTFVLVATLLAQSSRRGLSGRAIRARVALSLDLPIGSGVSVDALALALIARADLEEEWLAVPSTGSLASRRLAARLVERAAREAVRREGTGDESVLTIFERPSVAQAWSRLLKDREPLVWHHIATARGLLGSIVPQLDAEIGEALVPELTPTEWRRAAASLAASVAVSPERSVRRCRELLEGELVARDPGICSAMILGLARAAEAEPDAAEELLTSLVQQGGLDAIEALVELREEQIGDDFGDWAARLAIARLESLKDQSNDDGQEALARALEGELRGPGEVVREPTLRERITAARNSFATEGSRVALAQATAIVEVIGDTLDRLELASGDNPESRQFQFLALRELDLALLETSTLADLLMLGAKGDEKKLPTELSQLSEAYERLQAWLLLREREPVAAGDAVQHRTLRVRRLRALLHLVDADFAFGEEKGAELRERRLRSVRVLLARAGADAPSPLRRIVLASAARACEAMLRDDIGDLSDVLLMVISHLTAEHDLVTFAEASMMPEAEQLFRAYASLIERTERGARITMARSKASQDALRVIVRYLPAAAGPRVEALRRALLSLTRALDAIHVASSLTELAGEHGQTSKLAPLGDACDALARIVEGARRRFGEPRQETPACGPALRFVDLAALHEVRGRTGAYADAVTSVIETLREDLPPHVAEAVYATLVATVQLPIVSELDKAAPVPLLAKKRNARAELPPWMPPSRTIGGFFVLRALGSGAVGSVFIARRAEERANEHAPRFALKVPEFGGTAARTLSEEQFLQLFREEAGALLQIPNHPNLARLVTFDAGARPKPILVMELVEGPSLERIKETAGLDMPRALTVLDGVARGLLAMHEVGVGHLDLKPSNVILNDPDGPGPAMETPVLVDFGLAGRKIRPGCATANYGAPEVWGLIPKGHTPTPMGADVYAYGCLAYEVLTGKELFDGPNEMAILSTHLQHDADLPALDAFTAQKELAPVGAVLRSALRQDPRKRATMAQIHEALAGSLQRLEGARWPLAAA